MKRETSLISISHSLPTSNDPPFLPKSFPFYFKVIFPLEDPIDFIRVAYRSMSDLPIKIPLPHPETIHESRCSLHDRVLMGTILWTSWEKNDNFYEHENTVFISSLEDSIPQNSTPPPSGSDILSVHFPQGFMSFGGLGPDVLLVAGD